jgi:tetraacyldisaccharide 4'-kinase
MIAPFDRLVRARRTRYRTHPELARRLDRPVISVGNLGVGGSGKTPTVAHIVETLIALGERPSVLSRGYARRLASDGVVVVRDASGIRADLDRAGDEPLMLARRLAGTAVLCSPDRFIAGRLAEEHLGCTVHVLDDGFQHVRLARDADCVMVTAADLDPASARIRREPLDALADADAAILAPEISGEDTVKARLPLTRVFETRKALGRLRFVENGMAMPSAAGLYAVAAAGIADPRRFFADAETAGLVLARTLQFPDHHRFTRQDVTRMQQALRETGAVVLLTTEKDMVRLLPYRPFEMAVAWLPMSYTVTPPDEFRAWLADRIAEARRERRERFQEGPA